MHGVFEEFGGGRPVTPDVPAHPLPRRDALVRLRQAGPAQPDQDAGRVASTSAARASVFAGLLEQPGTEVRAIPAPGGGSRAFCDRMNAWAQGEGLPGLGYIFWREGRAAAGGGRADRQEPRAGADRGDPAAAGPGRGRRGLLRRRPAGEVRGGRRQGAQRHRHGAGAGGRGPVRLLLDRRLPDVREGRDTGQARLQPQPLLDAAGRAGGAGDPGPARRPRPTSTTSSATASSCPRARSGTTSPRSCSRPSRSPATTGPWSRSSSAAC